MLNETEKIEEIEEQKEEIGVPLLAKKDPFDPTLLVGLFKKYEIQIGLMDGKVAAHRVTDDASNSVAVEMTTQAKGLSQAIEKKRKEIKEPYLAVTKALDGFCKGLIDRLSGTQQVINEKIQPYLQKKERERLEAERKTREKAARLQAEAEAELKKKADRLAEEARQEALASGMTEEKAEEEAKAAKTMIESVPVFVAAELPPETKTITEAGTAKIETEWTWEIQDLKLLPQEAYNSRKAEVIKALTPWVNAQVKAGTRKISGVKIFQQTKIKTRTKRR